MTDKAGVIADIQAVDQRIAALRERVIAAAATPLLEGEWSVRDVLSHLAARANPVALVRGRIESPAATPDQSARRDIVAVNQGQIDERRSASATDLLDEIRQGHAEASSAIQSLDEAFLSTQVSIPMPPGEVVAIDLIQMAGPRHDNSHWDAIEAALPHVS